MKKKKWNKHWTIVSFVYILLFGEFYNGLSLYEEGAYLYKEELFNIKLILQDWFVIVLYLSFVLFGIYLFYRFIVYAYKVFYDIS